MQAFHLLVWLVMPLFPLKASEMGAVVQEFLMIRFGFHNSQAEHDNTLQFSAFFSLFLSLLCEHEDLKHVKQAPTALLKGQSAFRWFSRVGGKHP